MGFDLSQYEFIQVAPLSELPSGQRMLIDVGDVPVVIFNIAGNLYAIDDLCTHDEGTLADGDLNGFEISCPRHGACFDVRSGQALTLPAVMDTTSYPVRVTDEMIEIGLPK